MFCHAQASVQTSAWQRCGDRSCSVKPEMRMRGAIELAVVRRITNFTCGSRSILISASYIEACGVNLTAREKKGWSGAMGKFHPIPAYGPHISWFVHAKILHNTGKSMAKIGRQHLPSPEDLVPTCMIMHPIYQLRYIYLMCFLEMLFGFMAISLHKNKLVDIDGSTWHYHITVQVNTPVLWLWPFSTCTRYPSIFAHAGNAEARASGRCLGHGELRSGLWSWAWIASPEPLTCFWFLLTIWGGPERVANTSLAIALLVTSATECFAFQSF